MSRTHSYQELHVVLTLTHKCLIHKFKPSAQYIRVCHSVKIPLMQLMLMMLELWHPVALGRNPLSKTQLTLMMLGRLGRYPLRPMQLTLMMLGLWRLARQANTADADDAGAFAALPPQANAADAHDAGALAPSPSSQHS